MKTIRVLSMIAALAVICLIACEDDPADPPVVPPSAFKNLTQREHVLNNVELAYNKRRLDKYDELLDDNFTFFLYAGDVGGDVPESWLRDTEIQANTNLFSKDPLPAPYKQVLSILMDVQWEDDQGNPDVVWVEFTPPGLTESWYTTTVRYDFKIELEGDLTYFNNPGATAQFTVRNAGTADAPQWRLVEMRDLGANLLASSAAATESSTWGSVKALYR